MIFGKNSKRGAGISRPNFGIASLSTSRNHAQTSFLPIETTIQQLRLDVRENKLLSLYKFVIKEKNS